MRKIPHDVDNFSSGNFNQDEKKLLKNAQKHEDLSEEGMTRVNEEMHEFPELLTKKPHRRRETLQECSNTTWRILLSQCLSVRRAHFLKHHMENEDKQESASKR